MEEWQRPARSAYNNVGFTDLPGDLEDMDDLGDRLCALHMPFQVISQLPRFGQPALQGGVVNVENRINEIQTALIPRIRNGTAGVVWIKLKRRLQYKTSILVSPLQVQLYRKWMRSLSWDS